MNLRCIFPDTLRVAIMDQDSSFSNNYLTFQCDNTKPPTPYNLTALSLSGNTLVWETTNKMPTFNNLNFPYLRALDLSKNKFSLNFIQTILNYTSLGLKYLESLDISYFDRGITSLSCSHSSSPYHPWFLSADKHLFPDTNTTGIEPSEQHHGFRLPPRLENLTSLATKYPLNIENVCQIHPTNRLTNLDISGNNMPVDCDCSNISGFYQVRSINAKDLKFGDSSKCFNLGYLLNWFPQLVELNLIEAENVLFHDVEHFNLKRLSVTFQSDNLTLDLNRMFPNLNSLSAAYSQVKYLNITLPFNLQNLSLFKNQINYLSQEMQAVLTSHSNRVSKFIIDLRSNPISCLCACNSSERQYVDWLLVSKFVLFDMKCQESGSNLSQCILQHPCTKPDPNLFSVIGLAVGLGAVFIFFVVVGFFIFRRFQWRIRFGLRRMICCIRKQGQVNAYSVNKLYLSFCTSCEVQTAMAFAIWSFAQRGNFPEDMQLRSRWDILPGECTNDMVTKYICESDTVLLLMPDNEYSSHDDSMYELQLAIHFHQMCNIRPILSPNQNNLEDIASRFPPLVAEALNPFCLPIYPTSDSKEDIAQFFSSLCDYLFSQTELQIAE